MQKAIPHYPKLSDNSFLIDTHCHLDMEMYKDDLEDVIERAYRHGVHSIISIGIDVTSSQNAVKLAQNYQHIHATIGIHPHDVDNLTDDDYERLRSLYNSGRDYIVGYGEIGLDYVKKYSTPAKQRFHFSQQLDLSTQLGLPIVVHNRDADKDTLEILQNHGQCTHGGVVHCFSGDYDFAKNILALGMFISIPGIVTFKNATTLHNVVKKIPLENMIIETDGPFLSPHPYRGKRNEPANVLFTADAIATLKGVSLEEVARQTTHNAQKLFNLP